MLLRGRCPVGNLITQMTGPTGEASDKCIDARLFWRALGQRAIGSTIVTARSAAGPAGFLGLSASHVSADPPLMLASIDKRTSALATVLEAKHFAVNFLPREAATIADVFGGKGTLKGAERFEASAWTTLSTGAPVLKSALGAMDCRLEEAIERYGSCIVIGRVVDVMITEAGSPLVHFRGGYLP
jgi:flavin reductase (DIM6/NTAB) family NADH-FMN oxidoreductase RutF